MSNALIVIPVIVLTAAGGLAYVLGQRGRFRAVLAVLALAPVTSVLPYVALTGLNAPAQSAPATATSSSAAPSAAPSAAAPASAPTPVAGAGVPGGADRSSVAPVSGARPASADAGERDAAQALKSAGNYGQARDAFRRLAARHPGDADAWADAADCAAAAAAGNLEAGAEDLEHALAASPVHPKALWLKASLELQRRHYSAAVAVWRRLLDVLPPGSEDRRTVEANLAEAKSLLASNGKAGG